MKITKVKRHYETYKASRDNLSTMMAENSLPRLQILQKIIGHVKEDDTYQLMKRDYLHEQLTSGELAPYLFADAIRSVNERRDSLHEQLLNLEKEKLQEETKEKDLLNAPETSVVKSLLFSLFKDPNDKRSSSKQSHMRRDAITIYELTPDVEEFKKLGGEVPSEWVWDVVTGTFKEADFMIAAHLVPAKLPLASRSITKPFPSLPICQRECFSNISA